MDLMKKAFLTGLGFAVFTKEKVEEFGKEVAEKTGKSKEEGEKFVEDLLSESEKARKEMQEEIAKSVKEQVNSMGLVTKEDLKHFEAKIDALVGKKEEKEEKSTKK